MTTPTVLLVEADILIRGPLATYLRDCGYRVIEAARAAEARACLDDASIAIDVALVDIAAVNGGETSGEHGGFALAKWIREKHPDIVVSLVGSAEGAVGEAKELCEEGPSLRKPYDHQLVLREIKRLLAARDRKPRPR